MKFETTPAFEADLGRLKREHLRTFTSVVRERFAPRVRRVRGRPGPLVACLAAGEGGPFGARHPRDDVVFREPGRATFEPVTVDGELRCRWRRIGDHDVFKRP